MSRSAGAALLFAFLAPSCVIYNDSLLDESTGGDVATVGGTGGASGGTGGGVTGSGGAASGGAFQTGGGPSGGTGSGGVTNVTGSGGDASSGGGGMGMPCESDTGSKEPLTGVSSTQVLDHFDNEWTKIGDGAPFSGDWITISDGTGTDLLPFNDDSVTDWGYDRDACFPETDTSLRITGTNFTGWGASYDANLISGNGSADLSAYDGLAFWGRSEGGSNLVKIAFTYDDGGSDEMFENPAPFLLPAKWKLFKVPFGGDVKPEALKIIHLVASADNSGVDFDLWIDDFTFYKNE